MKLRRYGILGNVLVVGWKGVALKAKWADPETSSHIHLAIKVLVHRILKARQAHRAELFESPLDKLYHLER